MIYNNTDEITFETKQIKSHSVWVKTKEPDCGISRPNYLNMIVGLKSPVITKEDILEPLKIVL